MNFSTSYDTTTKFTTPIALVVMISGLVTLLLIHIDGYNIYNYIMAGVLFLTIILSIAFAPKSYDVDDGVLYINRLLMPPIPIKISDITAVKPVTRQELKGSIRLFGSGAFLGYYGIFSSKALGRMNWYATNLNNAVLIKTSNGKKHLLTPDERDAFMQLFTSTQNERWHDSFK